ncbi:MAG: glycosyltransferase family 87 protein [Rhodomicrobium sp.]
MPFANIIELTQASASKRAKYNRLILSTLAVIVLATAAKLSGAGLGKLPRGLVDFDDFFIAGQLVWHGEIEKAYRFATLAETQRSLSGVESFIPWTYPPQFDLMVAPLALLPLGVAYFIFTGATLAAYLATLRRIAAERYLSVLIVLFPAIAVTIACGQNGFLTGALIGLTCLLLLSRRSLAGLPLGLMVIKPHLAVAFAVYTAVNRRWGAVFAAAATVAVTSALATVLLGAGVWTAFLGGVHEARVFLEHGFYPLHRMVSPYAVFRTLGFSALAAISIQIAVALFALALVCIASFRFSPRQALGVTAIASLLISPYAYDYDLPIVGIGLAMLLPDFIRLASERERLAMYGLSFVASSWGLAQATIWSDAAAGDVMPLSMAGLALVAIAGLTWRILSRDAKASEAMPLAAGATAKAAAC